MALYAVGRIRRSFGVKGLITVEPFTHSPQRFEKLKTVYIGKDGEHVTPRSLKEARVTRRGVVVKLDGIEDKDAADKLAGQFLFIEERDLLQVPGGFYFIHDIIGCDVHENGRKVGKVIDVYAKSDGLAQDVWVIENIAENGKPAKQYWVPAVREFIQSVEVHEHKIIVQRIEDFLQG